MSPTNRNLSHHVDGRLAAYATLAGVALAAPAFAPSADAAIVYNVINLNIPTTTSGVYLQLAPFASGAAPFTGWDFNPWGSSSFNAWANNSAELSNGVIGNFTGGSSATLVDNIPVGTVIDGSWSYVRSNSSETTGSTAFNLSSSNNLIGIRFFNNTTGALNFGWIRISLSSTAAGQPRAIVEYAYEDSGGAILAGAIPEPSTLALFGVVAVGAIGVRAWRKRKAA